ncbi:MAG: NAD-binding protein [Bacteroidetes bacterium]|nr:NAD-binding protein [Bacteroidota bacterium]
MCGAGKYGKYVLEELQRTRRQVVVIDKDHVRVSELLQQNIVTVEGDASHDDILRTAGIDRARGLIATLPDDKENLFIVITVRGLNPSLRTVANVNDVSVREKFLWSGTDAAVSATYIGGLRMASECIRPETTNFLDAMLRNSSNLRVDQITLCPQSKYVGKKLYDVQHFHETGVLLVGLQRINDSSVIFNPPQTTLLQSHDILIVIGTAEQRERLQRELSS